MNFSPAGLALTFKGLNATNASSMKSCFLSLFASELGRDANRSEIVGLFGDPEEIGQGLGGRVILAYRNKSIQIAMKGDQVMMVSIHFDQGATASSWPEVLEPMSTLSGYMIEQEISQWLDNRSVLWCLSKVAGNSVFEISDGVTFCTEGGRLSSVHAVFG